MAHDEFTAYLLELMAPLGDVRARRMFGGAGLYLDGCMFALIAGERLYFKVDEQSRRQFEAAGAEPFSYVAGNGKRVSMSYWSAPAECIETPSEMMHWARLAYGAALRAAAGKAAKARKASGKAAGK